MTKFKITKREMIKAVATENLKPETFFHREGSGSLDTCPVCAVGAIMRKMGAAYSVENYMYKILSKAAVDSRHIRTQAKVEQYIKLKELGKL